MNLRALILGLPLKARVSRRKIQSQSNTTLLPLLDLKREKSSSMMDLNRVQLLSRRPLKIY